MIKQVVRGGPGKEATYREFIISGASDVSSLPNSANTQQPTCAGSLAYTQDLTKTYLLGPDDVWREV